MRRGRPVSIVFEDGSTVPATATNLQRALRALDDERDAGILGVLASRVAPLREALQRKTRSEDASGHRNGITKADIEAFRDKWRKNPGKGDRGWKAAACREFAIDRKTLDSRLNEESAE